MITVTNLFRRNGMTTPLGEMAATSFDLLLTVPNGIWSTGLIPARGALILLEQCGAYAGLSNLVPNMWMPS